MDSSCYESAAPAAPVPKHFAQAVLAAAISAAIPGVSLAQAAGSAGPPAVLPEVRVTPERELRAAPPRELPAVTESVDREQIRQSINAADAEDTLKYLPSMHVRKRYIGDFDHAIVATRTNGTGVNARTLVFADGIMLSNLLGNSNSYTPRWGLVTPEEIERVDVIYGPYSAAYAGNAVGGVVNFVTRMPDKLEAYAKVQVATQNFKLYGAEERFSGKKLTTGVGNKIEDTSFWINYDRLDSASQPLVFVAKNYSAIAAAGADPVVTGAVANQSPTTAGRFLFGSTNQINTVQDHFKAKIAYDFSPTARLAYTGGVWDNQSDRSVKSYVRDAAGNPVYSGNVNINGQRYTLAATDFQPLRATQQHWMHGLQFKTDTKGAWDWEAVFSTYSYNRDIVRQPTVAPPAAFSGGAGRITDMNGTGWSTFDAKGTWRPQGYEGAHTVDFGVHRDSYQLRSLVSNTTDWIAGGATTEFQRFAGRTQTTGWFIQDAWRFAPAWKATLGLRWDRWQTSEGFSNDAVTTKSFDARTDSTFSPKLAIQYQWSPRWNLRASYGRAVRTPTVAELYQGGGTGATVSNSNPNLKPEKAHSLDVTAERDLGNGTLRVSYFQESLSDALYSQTDVTGDAKCDEHAKRRSHPHARHRNRLEGAGRRHPRPRSAGQRDLYRLDDSRQREESGQHRQAAAAHPRLARFVFRHLAAKRCIVVLGIGALQRPHVQQSRQLGHQRQYLYRVEPFLCGGRARVVALRQTVERRCWCGQPQQRHLLGVPSVYPAYMGGGVALRTMMRHSLFNRPRSQHEKYF